MNDLLTGGIFVTLLVSLWSKVKVVLWSIGRLFLVKVVMPIEYVAFHKYYWDHLKNHKFLVPLYISEFLGSGGENKLFAKIIGGYDYKLVKFKKRWALGRITDNCVEFLSFKFYIGYEDIYNEVGKYHSEVKRIEQINVKNKTKNRFSTAYKRGSINSRSLGSGDDGNIRLKASYSSEPLSISAMESYDIGIRACYTQEEYQSIITFHDKKSTLLDKLYLNDEMVALKRKIESWFENKKWFLERGIQWKRGVLLHGVPGTGKTSFVVALAEYFGIPLYVFDLSTFTNEDLENKWEELKYSTPCFVIFEDFDAIFDKRKHVESDSNMLSKPLSFDCVLNILDGAVKYDGIVTFITTNKIEKIDSALGGEDCSRPGRIDYVCEMPNLNENGKKFIADSIIYGFDGADEIKDKLIRGSNISTPAQFKDLCINAALEKYGELEDVCIECETSSVENTDEESCRH